MFCVVRVHHCHYHHFATIISFYHPHVCHLTLGLFFPSSSSAYSNEMREQEEQTRSMKDHIFFFSSINSFAERVLTAGNDGVRARWPCVQFAAKTIVTQPVLFIYFFVLFFYPKAEKKKIKKQQKSYTIIIIIFFF